MKRGEAYAHSSEKRALDLVVAGLISPAYWASWLIVKGFVDGQEPVLEEKRIGQNKQPFVIAKFKTLNDETPQEPINKVASYVRKLGLDEVAQRRNILNGTMSAAGGRPLWGEHYEAFKDSLSSAPDVRKDYERIVEPTRPGIFSTYGWRFHEGIEPTVDQCLMRAECNIADVVNGSVAYDLDLIRQTLAGAVLGRFQETAVPEEELTA